MKRGDVVIIDFPYSDRTGRKVRPSLVVQSDTLNPIRDDAILAIITSMSSGRPDTEILIEVTDEPGSGFRIAVRFVPAMRHAGNARSVAGSGRDRLAVRAGNAEGEPVPQGGVGAAMISSSPDTTSGAISLSRRRA